MTEYCFSVETGIDLSDEAWTLVDSLSQMDITSFDLEELRRFAENAEISGVVVDELIQKGVLWAQ